jgi:hypothetical protein
MASLPAPFALAPNAKVLHGRRGLEGTELRPSVNLHAQGVVRLESIALARAKQWGAPTNLGLKTGPLWR